jgi:hypothetical protein
MTSYLHGKSYTRQTVANIRLRQFADNHPASYGWTAAAVNRTGLVIWQKDGCLMQRHPAGDCWLIHWCGVWQPIDMHVSELSAKLKDIKEAIFWDVISDEFEPAAMAA